MAKLNYLNRKSEGLKLGQIVAKDLRKRHKPPPSKSDHKDTTPLEIFLEAKNLGDDGLREVALGLVDALAHPESTRITTLHLARNGLTARSLLSLAGPMRAACPDLDEIDLSGNAISVETREEVDAFEAFLEGLRCCQSLGKINLSGNNIGGSKAMEVFGKVYLRHFKANVNLIEAGGEVGEEDNLTDDDVTDISRSMRKMSVCPQRRQKISNTRSLGPVGLATVEEIDLSSCSITDAGALWLSYVLPRHAWAVSQLGNKAEAGITCWPNDTLSPIGKKLLHQAEATVFDSFQACEVPADHATTTPPHNTFPSPSRGHTKSNGAHNPDLPSKPHAHDLVDDLSSSRKKIQRAILENKGALSVDLWRASLRLLTLTRQVMLASTLPALSDSPDRSSSSDNNHSSPLSQRSTVLSDISEDSSNSPGSIRHRKPVPLGTASTYASRLLLNTGEQKDALFAVTEAAADHSIKATVLRARKRRDSFSIGSDIPATAPSQAIHLEHNIAPTTSLDHALVLSAPIAMSTYLRRGDETMMMGSLPKAAWERILPMVADEGDVLSEQQRRQIMDYAQDRGTLSGEKGNRGKAESVQIWRCLEGMGGLEYDGL